MLYPTSYRYILLLNNITFRGLKCIYMLVGFRKFSKFSPMYLYARVSICQQWTVAQHRVDGSSTPIRTKIGEQARLDLPSAQKKSGCGNVFHFRDIDDFRYRDFRAKTKKSTKIWSTKNRKFWSTILRNFRGTFPENKYDCGKIQIQSFSEHPKLSKSVQQRQSYGISKLTEFLIYFLKI